MPYVVGRMPEHETLFFRVKWLQPAMKGTSCVQRVWLGSFGSFYVFCNNGGSCVCSFYTFSWSWGCRSHWNGCMNVAWVLFWGGSRSTKPCVFPCKVAAAGDERYLVCAAVAAAVVWFLLCVLQQLVVPVCVVLCVSWSCGCRSHWNGCMNVAWAMFWGGSRSTKPCVFPCKVAAAGDERYLVCAAVAAAVVWFPSMCFATMVVPVCVVLCVSWSCGCRSHWIGCMNVAWVLVLGRKPEHETLCFCKVAAAGDERYLVCAQEYWFGLLQIWTLRWLFRSLDNCLHGTRRYLGRTTLRCPDRWWCARCGHVVECLPSRCRMSFCRKQMQLGSAMSLRIVRTSCLICFVKCHDGQPGFQRDKLSSLSCQCGPKKLPKA